MLEEVQASLQLENWNTELDTLINCFCNGFVRDFWVQRYRQDKRRYAVQFVRWLLAFVDTKSRFDDVWWYVDIHVASEKCFFSVEVFKHLDTGTCLSGMCISQDMSDDTVLALPARHDREAFVLADRLDCLTAQSTVCSSFNRDS